MPTNPPNATDKVLTPPEQDTKPKLTPTLALIAVCGLSPAEAAARVKTLGKEAAQLVKLYRAKNVAEIRKLSQKALEKAKPKPKPAEQAKTDQKKS